MPLAGVLPRIELRRAAADDAITLALPWRAIEGTVVVRADIDVGAQLRLVAEAPQPEPVCTFQPEPPGVDEPAGLVGHDVTAIRQLT